MNKGIEVLSTFTIQKQNGEYFTVNLFKIIDYEKQPNKTMTDYLATYQINVEEYSIEYFDIVTAKKEYLTCIQNLLFPKKEIKDKEGR